LKSNNKRFSLKEEGLTVLSLFDGISCGQVAFERVGIKVKKYYAFEIETNAIKITMKNYPNTVQCGDVFDSSFTEFIDKNIDIVIGGSPCTFWSKAKCNKTAKSKKELDTNGTGWKLFMKYVECIKTVKPKYFLYENNEGIPDNILLEISNQLGVKPIMIDAALVSAQRRKRNYWTNIPNIEQPRDKGLLFKDIIVNDPSLIKVDERIGKTMIISKNYVKYDLGGHGYYSQQDRAYFPDSKAPTVPRCRTETKFNLWLGNNTYKKTCPVEIERLQTLPDNYTDCVPKTRRFEAIGNGWCVDVIAHIFSYIE
jgi:DNA (cytosine-5)-methyltransferase 3A